MGWHFNGLATQQALRAFTIQIERGFASLGGVPGIPQRGADVQLDLIGYRRRRDERQTDGGLPFIAEAVNFRVRRDDVSFFAPALTLAATARTKEAAKARTAIPRNDTGCRRCKGIIA
jgi:hypothetical protein